MPKTKKRHRSSGDGLPMVHGAHAGHAKTPAGIAAIHRKKEVEPERENIAGATDHEANRVEVLCAGRKPWPIMGLISTTRFPVLCNYRGARRWLSLRKKKEPGENPGHMFLYQLYAQKKGINITMNTGI